MLLQLESACQHARRVLIHDAQLRRHIAVVIVGLHQTFIRTKFGEMISSLFPRIQAVEPPYRDISERWDC